MVISAGGPTVAFTGPTGICSAVAAASVPPLWKEIGRIETVFRSLSPAMGITWAIGTVIRSASPGGAIFPGSPLAILRTSAKPRPPSRLQFAQAFLLRGVHPIDDNGLYLADISLRNLLHLVCPAVFGHL